MAYTGPAHLIVNPGTEQQRDAVLIHVDISETPPGPANLGTWSGSYIAGVDHHPTVYEGYTSTITSRLDLIDDGRTGEILINTVIIDPDKPIITGRFTGAGQFPA